MAENDKISDELRAQLIGELKTSELKLLAMYAHTPAGTPSRCCERDERAHMMDGLTVVDAVLQLLERGNALPLAEQITSKGPNVIGFLSQITSDPSAVLSELNRIVQHELAEMPEDEDQLDDEGEDDEDLWVSRFPRRDKYVN